MATENASFVMTCNCSMKAVARIRVLRNLLQQMDDGCNDNGVSIIKLICVEGMMQCLTCLPIA